MNEARIDKWLWAARIFKTRSMAAAACKKGQVSMKGAQLKPSRIGRARGTGRPTKKDRRSLEEFTTPEYLDDLLFDFDVEDEEGGEDD